MLKSEIVKTYLSSMKSMNDSLVEFKPKFIHEAKTITMLSENKINRFDVEYNDERDKLLLSFEINDTLILNSMNCQDTNLKVLLATIDFVSETYWNSKKNKDEYNKLLALLVSVTNDRMATLKEQKDILTKKADNFIFRLFHKNIDIAIQNLNNAIKDVENDNYKIRKELEFFNSSTKDKVIKTFVEEAKAHYGFMNLQSKTEVNDNE